MEKIVFVRFGGLSPVLQDQYKTVDKTFHNPPRKKGIYAFPWPYVEKFLLGSTNDPGHISNKTMWLRDDKGELIRDSDACLPWEQWINNDLTFKPWVNKLLKKRKISKSQVGTSLYKTIGKDEDDTKENIFCLSVLKKPRIFSYDGEIWHHFGEYVKHGFVLDTSGSWVKTDYDIYMKAFDKMRHHHLNMTHASDWGGFAQKDNMRSKNDPFRNGPYSKDALEVFIEKL
jgi:hypothetical protein